MQSAAIQKWGNSQGIRLPKSLLDALDWKINDKLTLVHQDNKLVLENSGKQKKLQALFENFEGEYKTEEIDWGEPVGKEIW